MIKKISGGLFLVIIAIAWIAPIGPMPGFIIGGVESPTPTSWGDTKPVHEVRLAANGIVPRVVIIWVVQLDGELYVLGANDSGWVERLGKDKEARVRIKDKTYQVTAIRQTESLARITEAYWSKYEPDYPSLIAGMKDTPRNSVSIFRLSRSAA